MSSFAVVAFIGLVVALIVYSKLGGSSKSTSTGGQKFPRMSRTTSWGFATFKSHGTNRTIKLERHWWPQLDRIGIELFDVTTKNPEGLAGTYVDLWAANPNRDDDLCRLDFEGGEVVKDHNGCEYFEVSRLYRNAKKKNGMLCRWSTETAPRPMDREGLFSARLDVFTLTAPWPWERAKDDPFHVSFAFIDNRVKKGMSPEQIVEDIEEKWRKDRKNRERESVELASNS